MKKTVLFSLVMALGILMPTSCKKSDEVFEPHSMEDLEGLNISVMDGSVQADYATANFKDRNINIAYYASMTDCLLAVNQGRADVCFSNNLQIYNDDFRRMGLNICHYVDEINAPFAFGIRKGDDELLNSLNEALDRYVAEGIVQDAIDRWFDVDNTDFHDCVVIDPCPADPEGNGPVLKVGISGVKQPVEVLLDNKWTGFEIELLQRYAAENGLQLQVLTFDFYNLIPTLQSGMIDVVAASLIISPERAEKINFSHSVQVMKTTFIVKGKNVNPVSFRDNLKKSIYSSLINENRWKLIASGLWTTIVITFWSLILGSILGAVLCQMKVSRRKFIVKIANTYLYFMKNIPMLVFLMLMFYVFLAQTRLNPVTVAIFAFAMNSAAFISDVFLTGIRSVDRGQIEAGRGIGCSAFQTFIYIVLPQAAKRIVPVFKNECITLLKSTAVVGYISIIDLTKGSDLIRSASFESLIPLIIITVLYFVLATLISLLLDSVLKKI